MNFPNMRRKRACFRICGIFVAGLHKIWACCQEAVKSFSCAALQQARILNFLFGVAFNPVGDLRQTANPMLGFAGRESSFFSRK